MKIDFKNKIIYFLGKNFEFDVYNEKNKNIDLEDYEFNYMIYNTNAKINLIIDKIIISNIILEHKILPKNLKCEIHISKDNSKFIIL